MPAAIHEIAQPTLHDVQRWLDEPRGAASATSRQEYDLELRRYDGRGWRAIFFDSGFEHSLTSHAGAAWARSPWDAVRRAAVDALRKRECPEPPPRDWTMTDESPR